MHYCSVSDLSGEKESLAKIRQEIHKHPELSFEEAQTAKLVADKLEAWGYEVTRNVGGHGVVGTLRNGASTRSVAVRADMDALPMQEHSGLPYASIHDGKMHACGHDGHTTMLLGAAQQLVKAKNFDGTVHLVFQPAEEADVHSGATKMLEDGLFERFPCDAIFGLHNHPGIPAGTFGFRVGPQMAACDTAKITIIGKGGHASRPHLSIDPIVIGSGLVTALQTIVSRTLDPTQSAVVTVSIFHAGTVNNVIPQEAKLEISIRTFSPQVRKTIEERIRALVKSHAEGAGATATVEYLYGSPVLINSENETVFAREVAEELVGVENVNPNFPLVFGSEDFAYYLEKKAGCFFRLGNGVDCANLHNPKYDFNDDILDVGAAFWTRLVERFLKNGTE